jgi:hypothetical protein
MSRNRDTVSTLSDTDTALLALEEEDEEEP